MSSTNISSNKDKSTLQLKTVNSINLDITDITKFVNGVEKHFGNYLFNKYIKSSLDTSNTNLNLHNDNAIVSNDNTIVSNDNAIVSNDNTIVSNDNTIVSNDNAIVSNDNTIVSNDTTTSNNDKLYKEFCTRFYYTKKALITQDDIIKKDISDMRKANILYLKYPELDITRTKTDFGYPSKYRCNFIRISKHKMLRCKNKISDTNDDNNGLNSCIMCSKHIYSDNIYREQYYKLYNKLINS
jgi:hypothetical protein